MTSKESEFTSDGTDFIPALPIALIAALARGEIDVSRLAREELANRGLDLNGHWIGFKKA